jgi:sulfur carrier protein ThiS
MGDHALAKAFVNQQEKNYQKLTILGDPNEDLLSIGETIIPPPPFAIGYRFWYGYKERVETMKKINTQMPDVTRDYIWLGGLLGSNVYHTKTRYQELNWALKFCDKFIYYFGDMHAGFNNSVPAKKLIDKINNSNSWIAVSVNDKFIKENWDYKAVLRWARRCKK